MAARPVRPTWPLVAAVSVGVAAAVMGALLGRATRDKWLDDLWFELAKAGIQIVGAGVVVGGLAAYWRFLNDVSARRHDADERRLERLAADYARLVALYNDVKRIRRRLRALGLDLEQTKSTHPRSPDGRLTEAQASGVHTELLRLNDAQLGFEAILRDTRVSRLLRSVEVIRRLRCMEAYLNAILRRWERSASGVVAGSEHAPVSRLLQPLFRKRTFQRCFGMWMEHITAAYTAELFGVADRRPFSARAWRAG